VKIGLAGICVIAAALCLCSSALAGQGHKFVCKRQSGGPKSSFVMTIDFDAKQIDVPASSGLRPDPDSIAFTATSVQWSFMRGYSEFHWRTGVLDWDTTAEYAYLAAIGQPSEYPERDYRGRMQCETAGSRR
jgi:hypothetical protein